jgi:hypothetical protein
MTVGGIEVVGEAAGDDDTSGVLDGGGVDDVGGGLVVVPGEVWIIVEGPGEEVEGEVIGADIVSSNRSIMIEIHTCAVHDEYWHAGSRLVTLEQRSQGEITRNRSLSLLDK